MSTLNQLERRIIELSYAHGLTHVSSCLNCVNLLSWIYEQRKPDDPVILANGHAGLALYVCLEKYGLCDAEEMIQKHGVHPSRDMEHGIWCSSGSLGQGETVAVGLALADKKRTVWLVTSDGSCMEGATMEAIRVGIKHCPNLKIHIVFNGFGAYGTIQEHEFPDYDYAVSIYRVNQTRYPEFLRGLNGHYLVLTEQQRDELLQ